MTGASKGLYHRCSGSETARRMPLGRGSRGRVPRTHARGGRNVGHVAQCAGLTHAAGGWKRSDHPGGVIVRTGISATDSNISRKTFYKGREEH